MGCKNKRLEKFIKTIAIAREKKQKSVVVYTTKYSDYKVEEGLKGFGANHLKPKLYEAYKYLLTTYDVETVPVNINERVIDWVVSFKK